MLRMTGRHPQRRRRSRVRTWRARRSATQSLAAARQRRGRRVSRGHGQLAPRQGQLRAPAEFGRHISFCELWATQKLSLNEAAVNSPRKATAELERSGALRKLQ